MKRLAVLLLALLLPALAGCSAARNEPSAPAASPAPVQTSLTAEQVLSGESGDIHYICYLPESYDGSRKFPMMLVMPGYDRMWFGESSSGNNLNWSGFTAWTQPDTEMIVVSAQLED